MNYISLGINIDQETEGLTQEQRQEFKRMLYALHVNGKVKFIPATDNVLNDWQALAKILDDVAYKTFQKTIGDKEPEKGFREIFPVIESKEMLDEVLKPMSGFTINIKPLKMNL